VFLADARPEVVGPHQVDRPPPRPHPLLWGEVPARRGGHRRGEVFEVHPGVEAAGADGVLQLHQSLRLCDGGGDLDGVGGAPGLWAQRVGACVGLYGAGVGDAGVEHLVP